MKQQTITIFIVFFRSTLQRASFIPINVDLDVDYYFSCRASKTISIAFGHTSAIELMNKHLGRST